MPSEVAGSSVDHTSFPVSRSYARKRRSDPVEKKISPPAVTSGPLRGKCEPVLAGMAISGGALTVPVGIRHLTSPLLRSYAVISDHGGPMLLMLRLLAL